MPEEALGGARPHFHAEALRFADMLTEPVRAGVLEALRLTPPHLVPRVTASSQSPWVQIDSVPGPQFAVWRATGDVYVVGEDGAVDDEPVRRGRA